MAQNYYQKEIETMSYDDMHKLQSERLVNQIKHVWDNVPFYRGLMEEKGLTLFQTYLRETVQLMELFLCLEQMTVRHTTILPQRK